MFNDFTPTLICVSLRIFKVVRFFKVGTTDSAVIEKDIMFDLFINSHVTQYCKSTWATCITYTGSNPGCPNGYNPPRKYILSLLSTLIFQESKLRKLASFYLVTKVQWLIFAFVLWPTIRDEDGRRIRYRNEL